MFYTGILTIIFLSFILIIASKNCDCNDDKFKKYDITQVIIVYLTTVMLLDHKSVVLFIGTILISFIIKEILKKLFIKKRKLKITEVPCDDCKKSYDRFN